MNFFGSLVLMIAEQVFEKIIWPRLQPHLKRIIKGISLKLVKIATNVLRERFVKSKSMA